MEIPDSSTNSYFRGVGDGCGGCCVNAIAVSLFDTLPNNLPHTFYVLLRTNLPVGGPNPAAIGVVPGTRVAGVFPANTSDGTFVIPIPPTFIPCSGGFSIGVELPAGTGADHLEVMFAGYTGAPTKGDYVRAGAPSFAWDVQARIATPSSGVTLAIAAQTCNAPTLNMGNVEIPPRRLAAWATSYGVGGMCPDVGGTPRLDGLNALVVDRLNPNVPVVLLISPTVFALAWSISPCANLWVDPANGMALVLGPLDASGEIRAPLLGQGLGGRLKGQKLWFQAFTLVGGAFNATNAQAVQW